MIVQCPGCKSRYRVREEKLPENGGNIQCPNCASVFPAAPAPPEGARSTLPSATAGGPAPPPLPAAEKTTVLETSKTPAGVAGAEAGLNSSWKVRTPVGLVYDFPDLGALRTWLGTRDSVAGMVASHDNGKRWRAIEEITALSDALPKGTRRATAQTSRDTAVAQPADAALAMRAAGVGKAGLPAPSRGAAAQTMLEKPRRTGAPPGPTARPAGRPSGRPGKPAPGTIRIHRSTPPPKRPGLATYFSLLVCSVVFIGAAIHFSGAYDVADALGLRAEPTPAPPPAVPGLNTIDPIEPVAADDPSDQIFPEPVFDDGIADTSTYAPGLDDAPSSNARELAAQGINPHRARVATLVGEAQRLAEEGDVPQALQLASSASQLLPDDPELLCLLADLHRRNGGMTEARLLRQQCEQRREAAAAAAAAAAETTDSQAFEAPQGALSPGE